MIRKFAGPAFWLLFALICFSTLAPVEFRPRTGHAAFERFGAYFALGGALQLSHPRRFIMTCIVISTIAVGLEAMQLIAPSRHARPLDAAEKLVGGLAGVIAALAAVTIAERDRPVRPLS